MLCRRRNLCVLLRLIHDVLLKATELVTRTFSFTCLRLIRSLSCKVDLIEACLRVWRTTTPAVLAAYIDSFVNYFLIHTLGIDSTHAALHVASESDR